MLCLCTPLPLHPAQPRIRRPHPSPTPCRLPAGHADWRDQAILQFRVQRKRALQNVLDSLEASLGLREGGGHHHAEGGEAGGQEGGEAGGEGAGHTGEEHEEL